MPTKILTYLLFGTIGAILFSTGYMVGIRHLSEIRDASYADGMNASVYEPLVSDEDGDTVADLAAASLPTLSVGTIKNIANDEITVTMTAPDSDDVTYLLDTETVIVERTLKTNEALSLEQTSYSARVRANPQLNEAPPVPYSDSPSTLSTLAVGDRVEILAAVIDLGSETAMLVAKIVSPE